MPMDLSQLLEDKPKARFDILKVYHKESGEVRLIKSTRFDNSLHSLNIPSNAKENLDFNHPNKAIELSLNDLKAPNSVSVEKVEDTVVSEVETPINASSEVVESFPCSKGCGKICASKAGSVSHERTCKAGLDPLTD